MQKSSPLGLLHLEKIIREGLTRREVAEALAKFRLILPPDAEIILLGGILRDLLFDNLKKQNFRPNDLDLILLNVSNIEEVVEKATGKLLRTSLGGFRWFLNGEDGIFIDFWRLEDSFTLKQFNREATLENLLLDVPFNVDRLCWRFKDSKLIEMGAVEGILNSELIYSPQNEHLIEYQAVRAVSLQFKTRVVFSDSVLHMIRRSRWQASRADLEMFLRANRHSSARIEEIFKKLTEICDS